jgi:hypothetical protein
MPRSLEKFIIKVEDYKIKLGQQNKKFLISHHNMSISLQIEKLQIIMSDRLEVSEIMT